MSVLRRYWPKAEAEHNEWGRYGYDRSIVFEPFGVQVLRDSSMERCERLHGGRCCVVIPGGALDALSGEDVRSLISDLVSCWCLFTRFDVAFDDLGRTILPHEVAKVAERGDFTSFRRWEHRSPRRIDGSREGDMVTFGRRGSNGSGRFVRCYDKSLEDATGPNAVRWEVEFSGRVCREIVFRLTELGTVESFAGRLAALVGGSIDFVKRTERAGDRNVGRLKRHEWWSAIVDSLGSVRYITSQRRVRVESARSWFENSVSATAAMLRTAMGDESFAVWLADVMEFGESRQSARHRGAVQDYWSYGGEVRSVGASP